MNKIFRKPFHARHCNQESDKAVENLMREIQVWENEKGEYIKIKKTEWHTCTNDTWFFVTFIVFYEKVEIEKEPNVPTPRGISTQ